MLPHGKTFRRIALFSACVSLALAPALQAPSAWATAVPNDHGCMGHWVGEGRNTGMPTSWTIDLTLTAAPAGGRCGTIEYTRPTCGGTLESCELVNGNIETREQYSHREGNCAPAGRVIIRCEGEQMHYTWIGWERVETLLHRAGTTSTTNGGQSGGAAGGGTAGGGGAEKRANGEKTVAERAEEKALGDPPAGGAKPGDLGRSEGPSASKRSRFGCSLAPISQTDTWRALLALVSLGLVVRRKRRSRSTISRAEPPQGE